MSKYTSFNKIIKRWIGKRRIHINILVAHNRDLYDSREPRMDEG